MNFWKMNALILKYIFCCAKIGNLNIDDLMIIVIHLAEQIQFSQNHLNKSVFFV